MGSSSKKDIKRVMVKTSRTLLSIFLLTAFAFSRPALAGSVFVSGAGGSFSVPVTTLKEGTFVSTKKQQYDFSCGSAAVATLLSFHYDDPVDETAIFKEMYEHGDKSRIQREGFSLFDMKKYLESRGYRADGFKVTMEALAGAGVPAISLVNEGGYRHFVVVKGLRDNLVLIGDPSRGTRVVSRDAYSQMAEKLFFVIRNKKEIGQRHFNDDSEWKMARVVAPTDQVTQGRGTADFTLLLPGRNEF